MSENILLENLSLLDKVIEHLITSDNYCLSLNNLVNKLSNDFDNTIVLSNLHNKSVDELFDDVFSDQNRESKSLLKIKEVLRYLESQCCIRIAANNLIELTYEGIIKHSRGYVDIYLEEQIIKFRVHKLEKFQLSLFKSNVVDQWRNSCGHDCGNGLLYFSDY